MLMFPKFIFHDFSVFILITIIFQMKILIYKQYLNSFVIQLVDVSGKIKHLSSLTFPFCTVDERWQHQFHIRIQRECKLFVTILYILHCELKNNARQKFHFFKEPKTMQNLKFGRNIFGWEIQQNESRGSISSNIGIIQV